MTRLEVLLLVSLACALHARDAFAVGTPAGTTISNQSQVSYTIGGTPGSAVSNMVTLRVEEILDVNVTLQSASVSVFAGDTNRTLRFLVTNTGNGTETLSLALDNLVAGDDFDPQAAVPAIYFDSDASGDLSAADVAYLAGSNDPVLAPDAAVAVLLVNDIPTGLADGSVGRSRLLARAATGTGTPGSVFAGQGDAGTDAVVGASGAQADAMGEYVVGDVQVAVVKSAAVADPFGGTSPVPGATITYTIAVTVTGTGTAGSLDIGDPIPANTRYVAGSLRLNGASLSDAADADAGEFQGGATPRVLIRLGDLTQAAGVQTLALSVTIN